MTLLLLALACAPKPAPASPAAPPAGEREALEDLAHDLARHPDAATSEAPEIGEALADALADRPADPLVRARALELLSWLRQADLSPEPAAPTAPVGEDTAAPGDTGAVDPDGVRRDARASTDASDTLIEMARGHLRRGEYRRAMDALRPLQGSPAWEAARPFWQEAVDGYVAAERERLGAVFMDARQLPHDEKIAAFEEVRDGLEGLLEAYPGSAYAEPLQDNLERVERALESAWRD